MKQQAEQTVVEGIRAAAKAAGVDYGTPEAPTEAAMEFDAMLNALEANPANRAMSFSALAEKAHRGVMAMRGVAAPAPAAPAPPPIVARVAPPGPPTIRNMPVAEMANVGGATFKDQLASANAVQSEEMWSKLTPAQRKAAMGD
jgi:hypothetical protein